MNLIALSGSLRAGSFNTALLHAAASLMPDGARLDVRTIHGIPLYDGDVEDAQGIPAAAATLGAAIAEADGLIICTPEYNNSIPGPLKNAIDWLSRIDDEARPIFANKPAAILGASPGGFGTVLCQAAWLPVLKALQCDLWSGGRFLLSHAGAAFDAEGQFKDAATRDRLAAFLKGFIRSIQLRA